jgi:hypothetical protein
MYFSPQRHRVLLEDDVDENAVDPGDQLAKEEGSDSDDETNSTGVVKSVTFADAIESTIEEAHACDIGGYWYSLCHSFCNLFCRNVCRNFNRSHHSVW